MHKRSLLWLGLAISQVASGAALGSDTSEYVSAFGTESGDPTDIDIDSAVPEKVQTAAEPLRDVGSFPVRVRRGDKDGLDWSNENRRNYVPKPASKRFKAGGCAFRVSTGDIGLTRYEFREDTHEVSVKTDPVLRFSTLEVSSTQGLLVSVNAELFVAPAAGNEKACKEKFLGRKVRFGKADMGLTEMVLEREGDVDVSAMLKAETYLPQGETPIFLTWNEDTDKLELVGKGGIPPAVGSPVFLVKPRAEGDYYLTVSPKLGIERAKKR